MDVVRPTPVDTPIDNPDQGLSADTIVLPYAGGRWVLTNIFARTCLGLESDGLAYAHRVAGSEPEGRYPAGDAERRFRVWEIAQFSNINGLLADPSRFRRDLKDWPEPESLTGPLLLERLRQHCLIVPDAVSYRARFSCKTSLMDRHHFGNFHEQLSQEVFLRRRMTTEAWWLEQKFEPDLSRLRNNLYGAVEGHFLRQYFARRFKAGDRVVDIGCGPGLYSTWIAETGASVLGIDPSEEYVARARSRAPANASFERMSIGRPGGCDAVPSASADYVFISDALLFYFVSPDRGPKAEIEVLFADIRRILAPGGMLINVEPHYLFWLAPWLGEPDRPFTVFTEYRRKSLGVTPSYSELIQAYAKGGFAVVWMEEMYPDPSFEATDPRAYHFAAQYPIGQIFELRRADGSG